MTVNQKPICMNCPWFCPKDSRVTKKIGGIVSLITCLVFVMSLLLVEKRQNTQLPTTCLSAENIDISSDSPVIRKLWKLDNLNLPSN